MYLDFLFTFANEIVWTKSGYFFGWMVPDRVFVSLISVSDTGKSSGILVMLARRMDVEGFRQKWEVKRNVNTHDL